jgi:hypothetical protein
VRKGFPIHSSSGPIEAVRIVRDGHRWHWDYINTEADFSLRSNDDFSSLDDARRSASTAYPHLEPEVVDFDTEATERPGIRRGEEARRLAVVAVAGAAVAALVWLRGRRSDDR